MTQIRKKHKNIMKRIVLIIMAIVFSVAALAQQETQKKQTKYENFISRTGVIRKYEDIKHTPIPTIGNRIQTVIRIVKGNPNGYYFGMLKYNEYKSAMIEYSDIVEVNKALEKLFSEFEADKETKPYYLKNTYKTVDGFEIGYYIKNKSVHWIVVLEWTDEEIDVSPTDLIKAFKDAQAKIEELKANEGR